MVIAGDALAAGLVLRWSGLGPAPAAVAAVSSLVLFGVLGHYRIRISPSLYRQAAPIAAVICSVVGFESAVRDVPVGGRLSRAALLWVIAVMVARLVTVGAVRQLRAQRLLGEGILVLGAGSYGCEMAYILLEHPEYGLRPVGFLDSFDDANLPLPVLGPVHHLDRVLARTGVRHVIIAFGATRDFDLVSVVRACERRGVEIYVVPRLFELGVPIDGREVENVWGIPLQRLRRPLLERHSAAAKRGFDIAVSGTLLLLISPLFGLLALLVKLSSPGPVFFRQRRIGKRGQPIDVFKFRSMRVRDDSDTRWTPADDSITPIGRVMRGTYLDELPQLVNVLRGDMSVVGPRPERPFFVSRFTEKVPRYRDRHRAPVGITGWAQVHGLRGDTPIDQRARFDNQYVENWSLGRDVAILVQTVWFILREAVTRAGAPDRHPQIRGRPVTTRVSLRRYGQPSHGIDLTRPEVAADMARDTWVEEGGASAGR